MILIVFGLIILACIGIIIFFWKGWPAIDRWFERRHSPDVNRCLVTFHSGDSSGGIWSKPFEGKLVFADSDAMTYEVEISKRNNQEITIYNEEGMEWAGGWRRIVCEEGSAIGHSPRVSAEKLDEPPQRLFNMRFQAGADAKAAETISGDKNGLDAKLVFFGILVLAIMVLGGFGIWSFSGASKKPNVYNVYTFNTTTNATSNQTPVITGTVVKQ